MSDFPTTNWEFLFETSSYRNFTVSILETVFVTLDKRSCGVGLAPLGENFIFRVYCEILKLEVWINL